MKKIIIAIFAFSAVLFSCTNTPDKSSEVDQKKDHIESPGSTVKNEVQVGDSTLVYKVSLGVLPDLGYEGVGMKIANVHEGKPGFKGGLKNNDIVVEMDGKPVKDLIEYTKILGSHKAGDSIELIVDRDGQKVKIDITFD